MNPASLCKMLRWKGWYGRDGAGPDWLRDQHLGNETQYSCLLTSQPWGPDDAPASIASCGAERACCRPRLVGERNA